MEAYSIISFYDKNRRLITLTLKFSEKLNLLIKYQYLFFMFLHHKMGNGRILNLFV